MMKATAAETKAAKKPKKKKKEVNNTSVCVVYMLRHVTNITKFTL